MKILLLSSIYPPLGRGGAEKAASSLAEALVNSGHEVSVLTLQPGKETSVEMLNGVRVHRIPMDNVYWPFGRSEKEHPVMRLLWHGIDMWNWRSARRVGRILDLEKPDVVHTHVIAGFSVAAWREVRRRKIRLVHTMHDYYMLCVRSSLFKDDRICESRCGTCKVMTGVRKLASPQVDEVVAVSQFVLKQHERFGYFKQVPGSVQFNVLNVPEDARASVSNTDDHMSKDVLVFGYIGKLEKPKGIEVLLAATQSLSGSDWRLKIAGTGIQEYVKDLQARFPDPRIEWLGFMESEDFYRSIDISIVPSLWSDPLPYVTIEGLFAGKSLICARSGGIPEIASLGKVVRLFPSGDVASLAALMQEALDQGVAAQQGGFLYEQSRNLFTGPVVAASYERIYRRQELGDGSRIA